MMPSDEAPPTGAQPAEPTDGATQEAAGATTKVEGEAHEDPSTHFNFTNMDFRGKDELGGKFGDGKMIDPATGEVVHSEEEPMSAPFVFMIVNFAVLMAILAWKLRPAAHQVARERHDTIKTALDEAAKLRQQAADKLAEYEKRLSAADSEIKALVDGMRKDAESDKARILANAEKQAAQMKRDAELRIAAEIELARAMLTREVTAAAATATEKILREKMVADDQQKLVGAFIAGVQSAHASTTETR
jgi:F-type H+-transporting ATPase subunit b